MSAATPLRITRLPLSICYPDPLSYYISGYCMMNGPDFNLFVDTITTKGYRDGINPLNAIERVVFLIAELDTMIPMESLLGYYDSTTGAYAIETVTMLEQIGANKLATLIREANFLFPNQFVPKDWEQRRTVLWSLPDTSLRRIEEIGDNYLEYPDDINDLLYKFVTAEQNQ